MRSHLRPLACLAGAAALCAAADFPKVTVARWPGDRAAAASLTFDDGMETHLDVVGPILKRHHLTGTFFVSTGSPAWRERTDAWRRLAAEGNEIASHTVKHPCLLDRITPHSQDYTPAMMQAEVHDSARDITEKLQIRRGITFAYPCGNLSFGRPADQVHNSVLYQEYVADCCFAARSYSGLGSQDPDDLNILNIIDLGRTAGRSSAELLGMLAPVVSDRAWGIYTFHGVGGQWLSVTADALEQLAAYLERRPEIWTTTFGDAVRYTQERRALGMAIARSDENHLELTLTWPLNREIFDLPLTLKADLPPDWKGARELINVPPGTNRVILTKPGTPH